MKKLIVSLVVALSIFAFVSCENEGATATLRIQVDEQRIARNIGPEEFKTEITAYRFQLETEKDGVVKSKDGGSHITTFTGIVPGTYTIRAFGLNEQKKELIEGKVEGYELKIGSNSVTVSLESFHGKGDLAVTLEWPHETLGISANLEAKLTSQSGVEAMSWNESLDASSRSFLLQKTDIEAGSYKLVAKLTSADKKIGSYVGVVNIYNGTTSKATIPMGTGASDYFDITPNNKTSLPIEAEIRDIGERVVMGKPYTAKLYPITEDIQASALTIEWFLDSERLEAGEPELGNDSVTFTVNEKTNGYSHTLTAIFKTDTTGSMGEAKVNFTAVDNGNPGAPVELYMLYSSENAKISGETKAHFLPNGDAVIFSNGSEKIFVVPSGTTNLKSDEGVYVTNYADVDVRSTFLDFVATGGDDYTDYYLYVFENNTPTLRILKYNVASHKITKTDKVFESPSNAGESVEKFLAADSFDDESFKDIIGVAVKSKSSGHQGMLFLTGGTPKESFDELVLNNMVVSDEWGSSPILSVTASEHTDTFTAVSSDHIGIYKMTKAQQRINFESNVQIPDYPTSNYSQAIVLGPNNSYYSGYGSKSMVAVNANSYTTSHYSVRTSLIQFGYDDGGEFYNVNDVPDYDRGLYRYIVATKDNKRFYTVTDLGVVYLFYLSPDGGNTFSGLCHCNAFNLPENSLSLPVGKNYDRLDLSPDGKTLIVYPSNAKGGQEGIAFIKLND